MGVWPCYECGKAIEKANHPVIGIDFSFCSKTCLNKYVKKHPSICQNCNKVIKGEPISNPEMRGSAVFCSWDCVKKLDKKGHCAFALCHNTVKDKKYVLEFCSKECLDKGIKLLEWAELAEGMLRD